MASLEPDLKHLLESLAMTIAGSCDGPRVARVNWPNRVKIAPIGSGGQTQSYKVVPPDYPPLCLKVPRKATTAESIRRESRFLQELSHRCFPRAVLSSSDGSFLYEEYIEGPPLTRLDRCDLQVALAPIARDLSDALFHLIDRERPIIHRDIKPQNLALTDRGVVVFDFGSAEHEGIRQPLPDQRVPAKLGAGTHLFQPPEQLLEEPGQDRRVDVFAAASVLFFLLTGELPYLNDEPRPWAVRDAYRRREDFIALRLSSVRPSIRAGLLHALGSDAARRPRDLHRVARAFEKHLE